MRTLELVTLCAGALVFERAMLVAIADRIARAPSLPAKMALCRCLWDAACRVRTLGRLPPLDVAATAFTSRADAHVESYTAALRGIPTDHAFLEALRDSVAPAASDVYARAARGATDRWRAGFESTAWSWRQTSRSRWTWLDRSARRHPESVAFPRLDTTALRLGAPVANDAVARRTSVTLDTPARERAIRGLAFGEAHAETWFVSSPAEHEQYLHQLVAFEINTFEAVSRHVAEYADMPWEFQWDMACQIRDELAHLEMWLERIATIGARLGRHALSTHEFAVCAGESLTGRLSLLERLIESAALDALDLNRCLWETRADATMVAYLQQVQRDEIAHVRQGNKWLRRLCPDDAELLRMIDDAERAARARAIVAARDLESRGLTAPGNVDLVRRKFDDPLSIEPNAHVRRLAGFSDADLVHECERRHRVVEVCASEEDPR